MTQEEFTQRAGSTRLLAIQTARACGLVESDAEDTAQDVMLRLWCLHRELLDEAHLRASAVIATKRLCIDRWRTLRPHKVLGETLPVADEDTPHDRLELAELEQWLDEQISRLPTTAATVLRMRQLEHRELPEIAAILGIGQASVSTLLSRARRELLDKLKRRNRQ